MAAHITGCRYLERSVSDRLPTTTGVVRIEPLPSFKRKSAFKTTVYPLNNPAKNEKIISRKDDTGILSKAVTHIHIIQRNM
jgi:hypothetical protein